MISVLAVRKQRKRNQFLKAISLEHEEINKKLLTESESSDTLNQELTLRNAELSYFAGIVAHDIKAPIRTTGRLIALIKKHIQKDDRINEYLNFIELSNRRLSTLIDNLLEYTRSGQKVVNINSLNLNEIIDIVKSNLNDQIQEKAAQVLVQDLPSLKANETEMIQLFQNIISNGIKFNNSRPPVIIINSEVNEEFNSVVVKDNGIIIKVDYFNKIFEPLAKLHSEGQFKGTGLGLATCKKIIENLGGSIEVKSILEKGTTFRINVPIELLEVGNCESPGYAYK